MHIRNLAMSKSVYSGGNAQYLLSLSHNSLHISWAHQRTIDTGQI